MRLNDPKMVDLFLKEVCKEGHMSQEQEKHVCDVFGGNTRRTRDILTLRNMRFVVNMCQTYLDYGVPALDIYIEGFLGLHEAAKRFSPDKEIKFTSYAVWWVRQRVVSLLAAQQPGYSRTAYFFMQQRAVIAGETGNMTAEGVKKVKRLGERVLSTEQGVGRKIGDRIRDGQAWPDEIAQKSDMRRSIGRALAVLPKRSQRVLILHYGLYDQHVHNLREVGEALGLTRERARQIKDQALRKLKGIEWLKEL